MRVDNYFVPAVQVVERRLQGAEYLVYAETGNTKIPNQIDEMAEREQDTQCFAWFHTRPNISRLEIRAALSLSINFLPVWLCTFRSINFSKFKILALGNENLCMRLIRTTIKINPKDRPDIKILGFYCVIRVE